MQLPRILISYLFLATLFGCASRSVSSAPEKTLKLLPITIVAKPSNVGTYPETKVKFANDVVGFPYVTYASHFGYRPLTLDLYLPSANMTRPPKGFPLVVYLHGGGWALGDPRSSGHFLQFSNVLASLAAKGYVVASVSYRLSGEAKFPASLNDVKASLRFLKGHAAEYDIDPERALIWGSSAGAHLAALTALTCKAKIDSNIELNPSECVQGAVAWYGIFNIATLAEQARQEGTRPRDTPTEVEWQMLGCFADRCKPGRISAASPVTYIDPADPPMLLIAGDHDMSVPYHQTLEMGAKLKAAGVPVQVLILPGADHKFTGKTLEQTQEFSLKAIEATFEFIDKTFSVTEKKRNQL